MLGRTKRREQRCQTSHPEENPRHTFHSPARIIGQCRHRDPTRRCMRSPLPATSDSRPRSSRQSIPIGHALGNGLVQPIFSPPSRRSPLVLSELLQPRRRPKNALRYDVNPTIGLWLLAEYPVLPGCEAFGCFARCRRGTNGLKGDCGVGSALPARLAAAHLRSNNEAER